MRFALLHNPMGAIVNNQFFSFFVYNLDMYKNTFVSILLYFFVLNCTGQSRSSKSIAKALNKYIEQDYRRVAPGCAVLVAKGSEIIYEQSFGTANIELEVPMQKDMVFRIGSLTKQYTAVAILREVEKGKISLGDGVQKFLKIKAEKWNKITIESLLTHTSGIIGYDALDFHIPDAIRIDFPPKQFIDSLAQLPLNFSPGSKFEYSNSNYLLLGCILENIAGISYQQYLRENIFSPAGLMHTYYDSSSAIIPKRVSGYSKEASTLKNAEFISTQQAFSAGALLANAEDLFKWHQALMSFKLVSKKMLDRAFTPFKLANGQMSDYGYGWFIREVNGIKSIGHRGAIDGFRSTESYYPNEDIFIAALFNSNSDSAFHVVENIEKLMMPANTSKTIKEVEIPDSILLQYAGTYQFIEDTTEFITLVKQGKTLYATLSNGSGRNMYLRPQTSTLFSLPQVWRIATTIEFLSSSGKVTGLYWTQQKRHEMRKIR